MCQGRNICRRQGRRLSFCEHVACLILRHGNDDSPHGLLTCFNPIELGEWQVVILDGSIDRHEYLLSIDPVRVSNVMDKETSRYAAV